MIGVELFAGGGGTTTGALAAGVDMRVAMNHWAPAVETLRLNHGTQVKAVLQDVGLFNPANLSAYGVKRLDFLAASPECRGHTNARGKEKAGHDESRTTAMYVVNFAEVAQPRFLFIENVPEMRNWVLYRHWRACLETLGYKLTETVVNAADFGVPQERVRLLICGVRNARRAPPHLTPPMQPWVPANRVIRWQEGEWSPVSSMVENTQRRVQNALKRGLGERFLVPYYSSGSGLTGRSAERPFGALTTRARWALVKHGPRGPVMRMASVQECKEAMSFPAEYQLGSHRVQDQHRLIGNAVPVLLARHAVRQFLEACA